MFVIQEVLDLCIGGNVTITQQVLLPKFFAALLGMDEATLGDKKQRRAFLSDPSHPIRFVYLPKHSSWLNQIEIVFGVISKRVMRHGSFTSTADLKCKLLRFIDYFKQTFAKPFRWTFKGKPKGNPTTQRPRTWREKTQTRKTEQILALIA